MVSDKVIVRLQKSDWYVVCETEQDVDLLLLVCKKAGLKWIDGSEATDCKPPESCPFEIGLRCGNAGMAYVIGNSYEEDGLQNITDWLFNAIRDEIIAQLKQNDWIIECESAEKVDWLLQACEEAGIKCRSGRRATKLKPNAQIYPIIIIYCAEDKTIHQGIECKAGTLVSFFVKEMGYKNITDWFFNAIKEENND